MTMRKKPEKRKRRAGTTQPTVAFLLVTLAAIFSPCSLVKAADSENNSTQTTMIYDLPKLDFRFVVDDEDMDFDGFKAEFISMIKFHIDKSVANALPRHGDLSFDYFDEIEFLSPPDVEKSFFGVESQEDLQVATSLVHASFATGIARFFIPPGAVQTSEHADQTEARLNIIHGKLEDIVWEAFSGKQFNLLLTKMKESDVLNNIQTAEIAITVNGRIVESSNVEGDQTSPSKGRTRTIIAAVFVGTLSAVLGGLAVWVTYYYFNSKRNNLKPKQKGNDLRGGRKFDPEAVGDPGRLDEWTQALTSIPLRQPAPKRKRGSSKRAPSRPAARQASKSSFLGCIPEYEDDEEEHVNFEEQGDVKATFSIPDGVPLEDVDLAGPEDYEPKINESSMVYI